MKIQNVSASAGLQWFKLGCKNIWPMPIILSTLYISSIALIKAATDKNLIFYFTAIALLPFLSLATIITVKKSNEGNIPTKTTQQSISHTLRKRFKKILALGALHALLICFLFFLPAIITGYLFAGLLYDRNIIPTELSIIIFTIVIFTYLASLIITPILYTSSLIHFHEISPSKAFILGIKACLRNWRAFSLYNLIFTAILLTLAIIIRNYSLLFIIEYRIIFAFLATTFFAVLSAIWCSSGLFILRDCFCAPDTAPQPSETVTLQAS